MSHITWMIPDLKQALQACDTPVLAKGTIDFLKKTILSLPAERDIPTALYHHFGGSGPLPRAALLALYYDLPPAQAWLLCEPVELAQAKRDVVCLGNAHFSLTQEEATAFAATFNAYWEGTGMVLYTPTPCQWLLALPEGVSFETQSLSDVLNQNVGAHLPTGDVPSWRLLFSQIQMLMQAHEVNRARAGRLPLVNGCWISGEGSLPVLEKRPRLRVMTSNPEAMALTRSVMGEVVPYSGDGDILCTQLCQEKSPVIIALSSDTLGCARDEDYLAQLEACWLQPYLAHERQLNKSSVS